MDYIIELYNTRSHFLINSSKKYKSSYEHQAKVLLYYLFICDCFVIDNNIDWPSKV